ncbi:hypothetical protein FZC66_17850 [Priestia megaterium]|nr:hypothetical protein FZC66_17850 [Priestia megaterium]
MSFLIFIIFLIVLNVIVTMTSAGNRKRWITWGLVVTFLFAPAVIAITGYTIGVRSGDGIGSFLAGFVFGGVTFLNGIIILVKGFMTKKGNLNKTN